MSTANESRNSSMTSEAYDLLDCFVAGLDEVIYEIAESRAMAKGQEKDGVVEITKDDVREAAEIVFDAIQKHAGTAIPQERADEIEKMHQCVLKKCNVRNTGK